MKVKTWIIFPFIILFFVTYHSYQFLGVYLPYPEASGVSLAEEATSHMIMIDAGHGGASDSGGIAWDGSPEKNVTLQYARHLGQHLEATGRYQVRYTRTRDRYVSPRQRAQMANRRAVDAFLSLHANVGPSHRSGYMLICSARSRAAEASLDLAHTLGASLRRFGHTPKRDIRRLIPFSSLWIPLGERLLEREPPYYSIAAYREGVYRNTGRELSALDENERPAVLIEIGYLTNREEALRMQQDAFQRTFVQAVERGLRRYFLQTSSP